MSSLKPRLPSRTAEPPLFKLQDPSPFEQPSSIPSPGPGHSPVQDQNGKNSSARSSMGPTTRRSAWIQSRLATPWRRAPSRRPTSKLLGSPTFQTPEAGAIGQWFENFRHYGVTLEEMAAASLDVNFKEELSAVEQWFKVLSEAERTAALYSLLQHSTQVQMHFFITVLQQMTRAGPMTALLSPAVEFSMQSQMEAKLASTNLKSLGLKSTMPGSPSARTFHTSTTNRQSPAFDSSSSFLSPDTANTVGNLSDAASTLAQQHTELKAAGNAAHRISAPALVSSGERGTWAGVLGQAAESSRPQSTDFSGLSASSAFRFPRPDGGAAPGSLDGLSPVVGDSWTNMVNTPLLSMFQKTSSNNNNAGQTVDIAPAKLNDVYGTSNDPRLDSPDEFRQPSKGHIHDNSSGSNNGVTNHGVYGDDSDLIQGHHAPGVGRAQSDSSRGLRNSGGGGTWSGAQSPALSNTSGYFCGSDDGSNAMAAAHQQAALAGLGMRLGGFSLGLTSPRLAGYEYAEPGRDWNVALGAATFSADRRCRGGFGQPGLGIGAGLSTFGGLQSGIGGGSGSASGKGGSAGSGGGGAKKDEEDFEPAVLNDVAAWLRTLRLHKYTPNFEGMTCKEMVMDEQALEAQGIAALGVRRKMLKTFEMVRRKLGIDDPTAPLPPPAPSSSGGPGSTGSGGGLSSA
ncbi:hypothetical protein H4582DRAFT_2099764 [Lactarius indigo]|nr:hypothetical protein H4582DRAFT_2099764 [Lactarius indigo]